MCRLREKKRAVTFGLFLLDQVSKYFALKFGLGFINSGISFGMFSSTPILIFVIVSLLLIVLLSRFKDRFLISLILIGGASNLFDRVIRGGVVDFISFSPLPVFNLADVMIVLGLALFVVDFFLPKKI